MEQDGIRELLYTLYDIVVKKIHNKMTMAASPPRFSGQYDSWFTRGRTLSPLEDLLLVLE